MLLQIGSNMNENIKKVLLLVLIFALGGAFGRFSAPSRVVEKEHTVTQDNTTTKQQDDKSIIKKDNKEYIRIVTIKPDGTRVTETHILDKDKSVTIDNSQKQTTDNKMVFTDKEKTTTYSVNSTIISLGIDRNMSYGGMVQRRLLGPIYVGGFGYTDGVIGLNLGVAF